MSKNVAVFVDVANIFYAAKAAGVDIDYVTLLKSATANRDFVRAYAYTGLDPENENQRQFHAFLARSGLRATTGGPEDVQQELEAIAKDYACDELGVVTICFDFEARRRSYALVAERFAT